MDVRAWLQNTADREPPDEVDKAGFPDYLQPERYTAEEHTHAHLGKRKRASSEPHSVDRRPSRRRHSGHERAPANDSSSEHVREVDAGTASSRSSSSDERREASPDRRFNRTFERRARHKTKEDRYEPKAKKRRKEREPRKDHKSKSKRRKSNRSGDGARTAGLVTSFQLKDKPKDSRLTLRPADISAGIFKHGRAGAPITGKGGLPDLVFNEMRFLRRPREHQDEIPPKHPDKQRGEGTGEQQEGNISAYFAKPQLEAHRPHEQHRAVPPLDQDPQVRSQEVSEAADAIRHHRHRATEVTGDRPSNSFLGFGSHGPNKEGSNGIRRSNSCYTWSESAPGAKSPAKELAPQKTMPGICEVAYPDGEAATRRDWERRLDVSSGEKFMRPRPDASAGRWLHSNKAPNSASVEVFQPAVSGQTSRREKGMSTRHRSSLSLPRSALGNMPPRRTTNTGETPGSCPTSHILRIRHDCRGTAERSETHHRDLLPDGYGGKENQEPSTSTPTSKLLRHAFNTITGAQTGDPNNARWARQHESDDQNRDRYLVPPSDDTVYHQRHMLAENQQIWDQSAEQQTFSMPERGFSRSTDASRAKQPQPMIEPATRNIGLTPGAAILPYPLREVSRRHNAAPEDEMLDNFPMRKAVPPRQQYTFTNSRQAEDLVRRLNSHQAEDVFQAGVPEAGYLPTRSEGPGDFSAHVADLGGIGHLRTDSEAAAISTEHSYSQPWCNNDGLYSAPDPGGGEVQRDTMPGFWKPNKLY